MENHKKLQEFNCLVLRCLEGVISPEEFARLDKMIASDSKLARKYAELISINCELYKPGQMGTFLTQHVNQTEESTDEILEELQALAIHEKTAPAKEILPHIDSEKVVIGNDLSDLSPERNMKFFVCTAIAASAALLFLLAYIKFVPPRPSTIPVAVLIDTVNAQWSRAPEALQKGDAFSPSDGALILSKGIAELLFENQTKVVLEGPAEFELISIDQITLHYGRLFASSPNQSYGFTVQTPDSQIVDLGTEFAVKVDVTGVTEVHMIKGKARLTVGNKDTAQNSIILTETQAKRVDAAKQMFNPLRFSPVEFVREIDSGRNLIWRGEPLNLADIVGGGDGFGTGKIGSAIDPKTGSSFMLKNITEWIPYQGSDGYVPISWHDFIDGVFVPNGGSGPLTVTTEKQVFEHCPETSRMYWAGISNGGQFSEPLDAPPEFPRLNNTVYGNSERPGLFMHSNLGITFDLNAIRKAYPDIKITEFRAACGICDNAPKRLPYADFWVLVDGQVRFGQSGVRADTVHEISISITDNDRFLTLITTDGGEEVSVLINDVPAPIDSDWCLFAEPYLILQAKE